MAVNEKCKATKNNFICTLDAGHHGEHLSAGGTWWREPSHADCIKLAGPLHIDPGKVAFRSHSHTIPMPGGRR